MSINFDAGITNTRGTEYMGGGLKRPPTKRLNKLAIKYRKRSNNIATKETYFRRK